MSAECFDAVGAFAIIFPPLAGGPGQVGWSNTGDAGSGDVRFDPFHLIGFGDAEPVHASEVFTDHLGELVLERAFGLRSAIIAVV